MNLPQKEPVAEQPYLADDVTSTPWAEAHGRLAEADSYWLTTVRPDGRPHLVPVLAVWVDGALHFVASRTSRKSRNLAHDSHCVIAASRDALDLVVEGEATKLTDEAGGTPRRRSSRKNGRPGRPPGCQVLREQGGSRCVARIVEP